jgi:polyisoprenyl-phosphate glycosyltransferase
MPASSISIVVPCHNEEGNIEALYARLRQVLRDCDYEIIFVNDGSTDRSLDCIKALRQRDGRVKYISFLTNYGHQKALLAGLRACHGDRVVSMDADLQHPPEAIPSFIEAQHVSGADIVTGRRRQAQTGLFKNLLSNGFYTVLARLTKVSIPRGTSDFRLYTRKAVDLLCSLREQEPFLRGMIPNLKLQDVSVDYDLGRRYQGVPAYTFKKSAKMAIQALVRFSDFPVRAGFCLGVLGTIFSLGEAARYVYYRLFTNELVSGQAEAIVFLALTSSCILCLLSLLCKLSQQILDHLREQPVYVVWEQEVEAGESVAGGERMKTLRDAA